MWEFIAEAMEFIADLASGDMKIEDARKRAAALQEKMPEKLTDALRSELQSKIDKLKG
jgi:hypothetical protein